MKRTKILRFFSRLAVNVTILGLAAATALADGTELPCSVRSIAGSWIFATDMGQLADQDGNLLGHIAAIGTMNIDSAGNVTGEFDVTRRREKKSAFVPNVSYWGVITVGPDCRGTLTFETSGGAKRTDSIAVLNSYEMRAITRAPDLSPDVPLVWTLWTYRVTRISSGTGPDVIEAKIDAVLLRLGIDPGRPEFVKDK